MIFLSGANQQIGTHQNLQAFNLENVMIEGVKVLLSIILTRWIINVKIQETIIYDCFKEHLEFFLVFAGGRQNSPNTRQHKQCIIQLYCTIHRNLYWSISFLHYFILAFHCMLEENIIIFYSLITSVWLCRLQLHQSWKWQILKLTYFICKIKTDPVCQKNAEYQSPLHIWVVWYLPVRDASVCRSIWADVKTF